MKQTDDKNGPRKNHLLVDAFKKLSKNACSLKATNSRIIPILFSLLLFCAGAQGQFIYTQNTDNSLTITGYTGAGGAVTIPSNIDNRVVTAIGSDWFSNLTTLTSVTIPDSVTIVGDSAFYYCFNLTNVIFGTNVSYLEDWAFYYCPLTAITLPDSVLSIGNSTFAGTSSASIALSSNVIYIGISPFSGSCITVDSNNPFYSSRDGVLFDKGQGTLLEYPPYKSGSYTIPSSVSVIATDAFDDSIMTNVTIPDNVVVIGVAAFNQCVGLTTITIPGSVGAIGDVAFDSCFGLTNVILSEGILKSEPVRFRIAGMSLAFSFPPALQRLATRPSLPCPA
jgi:hypothetical protein